MRNLQNFLKTQQKFKTFHINLSKNFSAAQEFDPRVDYYSAIGVPSTATTKEIKAKYYDLAKKYHPDVYKGQDDRFKKISDAYRVLGNADLKSQYDSVRGGGFSGRGGAANRGDFGGNDYYNMHRKYNYQQQSRKYGPGFSDSQNFYKQQEAYNKHQHQGGYNQSEFYNTFKNNYFYTEFNRRSQAEQEHMQREFDKAFEEMYQQENRQMHDHVRKMQIKLVTFGITLFGFWFAFDFLVHKMMGTGRHKDYVIYDEKSNMMYQVTEEQYKEIQAKNRSQQYEQKEFQNQQTNWVSRESH